MQIGNSVAPDHRSDVLYGDDWFLCPPNVALCSSARREPRPVSFVRATVLSFQYHINKMPEWQLITDKPQADADDSLFCFEISRPAHNFFLADSVVSQMTNVEY
jgi:hypothetical protein